MNIYIYIYTRIYIHIYKYVYTLTHTGWRRPIECRKLQDSFRERSTNYKALLQKMTCEDKASDGSSPPCITTLASPHLKRYCVVTYIYIYRPQ